MRSERSDASPPTGVACCCASAPSSQYRGLDGGGGATVGRLAAERLGFDYVDEAIVSSAAARGGIAPGEVAEEEQRKSALGRMVRELGRTAGPDSYGFAGLSSPYIEGATPDAVRSLIRDAIEETAGQGDVVIVSPLSRCRLDPTCSACS